MKKSLVSILTIFLSFALITCAQNGVGDGRGAGYKSQDPTVGIKKNSDNEILPAYLTKEEMKMEYELRESIQLRSIYSNAPSGNIYSPPEFTTISAVLVRVPNYNSDFDTYFRKLVAGIIKSGATPYMVVTDVDDADNIVSNILRPMGISSSEVEFVYTENDAIWTRDYGPWNVYINGTRAIVDNKYYSTRPADDYIPILLGNDYFNDDVYRTSLYVEGGNFMTDGFGTCFTTTGLLRRNNISASTARDIYERYLGCENTYFPEPLYGEGTTHIDMFSKILNQDTILVGYSNSRMGANSSEISSLEKAASFFKNTPKPDGGKWNVVRIPMTFGNREDSGRVQYSHTNSTIVNNTVLVPIYKRGTDEAAVRAYQEAMPGYKIITIDSNAPIEIGGAIHCTTMQIPAKQYRSCGDGVVSGSEDCDKYLNNTTCTDLGYKGGSLSCNSNCTFNTSACTNDGGQNCKEVCHEECHEEDNGCNKETVCEDVCETVCE